jgi:hypothetical protein
MKAQKLAVFQKSSCRKIAITLIIRPGACPEGGLARVNECNRLLTTVALTRTVTLAATRRFSGSSPSTV